MSEGVLVKWFHMATKLRTPYSDEGENDILTPSIQATKKILQAIEERDIEC